MESPRTLVHESPTGASAPGNRDARRRISGGPSGSREQEPRAEDLILGRYRLAERLGAGGFGVVWRAHDELLHREVAVKRIWLGPDGDSERAGREALASARLAHPAIVALYEACAVDDAFYLISELVDGQTLAQLIAAEELDDDHIIAIGLALVAALCHAHERGVIHRDIKPHNVLVLPARDSRRGVSSPATPAAKLTDFGGASLVGEDALTRTGDVLGTLAYMAPEQSEGHEVGEQADLYSLALVLYEALCGVNPVRGATPAATVRRIGRPIESLGRRRRDLPDALVDALDDALLRRPRDRGSLEDLAAALEQARDEQTAPRPRRTRAARTPVEDAHTRHQPVRAPPAAGAARSLAPAAAPEWDPSEEQAPARRQWLESSAAQPEAVDDQAPPRGLALPRALWIACALLVIGWQAWIGHAGVSLLAVAALVPLAAIPSERRSRRVGAGWVLCALAPALGILGLAAAFPAAAGQARRWRDRALRGAIGYWWLALAEPLLARRLWLGSPRATPARAVWEESLQSTAVHVIAPLFTLGVLLGALLWAAAAIVLPWLVRGSSAVLDVLAAVAWTIALVFAIQALDSGVTTPGAPVEPRGLVLGAVLGCLLAVAARALRGPV